MAFILQAFSLLAAEISNVLTRPVARELFSIV